jgi:hypothetical protein
MKMTKVTLSALIDARNKEKLLKEKLQEVIAHKESLEESIIDEMRDSGKREYRLGMFLISLKSKEKFSLPDSKSPMKGKLLNLLKEMDLLEVCSNLYAPKVKKLLQDKRLDNGIKGRILPYTITEDVYSLELDIVPEKEKGE